MHQRLPAFAVILGVAGLIPFVGCALAALGGAEDRARLLILALVGYGAVILAFLGGVHWGFALTDEPPRALRPRLGLGVVPSLIGWAALLVAPFLPAIALAVLIAGFIATAVVEARGKVLGLVPAGYMALRWGLTVGVVAVLTTVLVLRLAGARVVL